MKRRDFITKTSAGVTLAGMGLTGLSSCKGGTKKITILHTNDVHSHIDPFPVNHARFPNLGGVARRAALVHQLREENPNTLLLDAGDIFQGTPYFNFYGGELEFKLMSMLKYDAATIGNHDFDNGIGGLLAQLPHAEFDVISANYDFSNTVMEGMVDPYKIYERDGIRIGVFGLGINLKGLVIKSLYRETLYLDPIEMARDISRRLREDELCDLIICLSHLGHDYGPGRDQPSDITLAANTENIDLIIGGHTHTFLEKPLLRSNRKDQPVLINQVGCYGVYLGKIDFYFDKNGTKTAEGVRITV